MPSPSPDLLHIIVQFHNQEVDIDRIHGLYEDLHTLIFMCLYLVLSNFTTGVNLCKHHHNKHMEDFHYKDPQNHSHNHLLHSPFGISCQSLIYYPLLLFSRSVVSSSLRPHGLQHTRLRCPSPSPRVCSNSWPLSQWVRPSNHLILCCPLLLLASTFPSIKALFQ